VSVWWCVQGCERLVDVCAGIEEVDRQAHVAFPEGGVHPASVSWRWRCAAVPSVRASTISVDRAGPLAGLITSYRLASIPRRSRSARCWSQAAICSMPVLRSSSSEAIQGRVVAKLAGQNTSNARAPRSSRTEVSRMWPSPRPACIASQ
jgi:hypothetical protein